MSTKVCRECNETKDLELFAIRKNSNDGKDTRCKDCYAEYHKQYRASNLDTIRDNEKKYRDKNSTKVRRSKYSKEWAKANPEKRRQYKRTRRAKKAAVEEYYPPQHERDTKALFDNKCFKCGSEENPNIDHNYPLSKDFALSPSNAVLLCRTCNLQKASKLPEDFYTKEELTVLHNILPEEAKNMKYVEKTVTHKICSKCAVKKPLDGFKKRAAGKHGRTGVCKECLNAYQRKKIAGDRDKYNDYQNAWNAKNRDKINIQKRARYAADPDGAKKQREHRAKKKQEHLKANPPPPIPTHKECKICGIDKELNEYCKGHARDGHDTRCKSCMKGCQRQRKLAASTNIK